MTPPSQLNPYHHQSPDSVIPASAVIDSNNDSTMEDVEMEEAEVDMGYEEHAPVARRSSMGYEDHAPGTRRGSMTQTGERRGSITGERRGSMTQTEEKQRRASIKAIMSDTTLTPIARRRSIQHLMDGRRNSINGGGSASTTGSLHSGHSSCANSTCGETPETLDSEASAMQYGYGEQADNNNGNPYGDGDAAASASMYGYGDECIPCQQEDSEYGNQANGSTNGHPPYARPQHQGGDSYAFSNEQTKRTEQQRPSCSHYDRKCTIVAPCCGAAFGCRICHDDCPVLPPKINNGGKKYHRSASLPSSFTTMNAGGGAAAPGAIPEDNHHNIDRFAIREVICRECFTRQSSKTNNCVTCGITFGAYHCSVCNLWMSDEEAPYHCEDCGFCRVGGEHNFKHCRDCGMCIDKTLYNNHNCKAGKYRSNCPVCQEYLFSSRSASHEMPCGHAIHWDCFRQLAAHDSRCPVCKKTAETRERMMPTWSAMAAGVALQPVPSDLCRVVNITCNDCEKPEANRAWHYLGIQCVFCQSFNTVVDSLVLSGEEAHRFLEAKKQDEEAAQANRPRRRMNRRRSAF